VIVSCAAKRKGRERLVRDDCRACRLARRARCFAETRALTWIQQEQEFQASVIDGIELELGQLHGERVQLIGGAGGAEQGQREQVEALAVGQLHVVGQIVVHPLVDMVEQQDVRPRVLQQIHLVVDLCSFVESVWVGLDGDELVSGGLVRSGGARRRVFARFRVVESADRPEGASAAPVCERAPPTRSRPRASKLAGQRLARLIMRRAGGARRA
jgi:hypothetical protein